MSGMIASTLASRAARARRRASKSSHVSSLLSRVLLDQRLIAAPDTLDQTLSSSAQDYIDEHLRISIFDAREPDKERFVLAMRTRVQGCCHSQRDSGDGD